jgi:hypothetical protein
METYKVLSAATCTVELMGQEVGYMQSVDIQTTYNLQKIKNLYDFEYQGFVRGFADYTITARKAMIEADSIFGTIGSMANLFNAIKNLTNQQVDLGQLVQTLGQISIKAIDMVGQLPIGISAISDLKATQQQIQLIQGGAMSIGEFFTSNVFDLKIKTSTVLSDTLPGTIVEGKKDIWILKDCKLNARSLSLDMGNIIIMENVQIYARSFAEPIFGDYNKGSYQSLYDNNAGFRLI